MWVTTSPLRLENSCYYFKKLPPADSFSHTYSHSYPWQLVMVNICLFQNIVLIKSYSMQPFETGFTHSA